jgi:hypothetical protein
MERDEPIFKVKAILIIVEPALYYYILCDVGEKFNSMVRLRDISFNVFKDNACIIVLLQNQLMAESIYNIAWYQIPPRQRKLFLILLHQVQQPITFKAMKIFPVNLESFPPVIKASYSYFNVLQRIFNRR